MAAPGSSIRKFRQLSELQTEFDELCSWIEANLHQTLGWQELMAHSGLDHQTINAMFYRFQSTTPMTWIRRRRELAQLNPPQRADSARAATQASTPPRTLLRGV